LNLRKKTGLSALSGTKIHFRPGSVPDTAGAVGVGAHGALPDPLIGCSGRGKPLPIRQPFNHPQVMPFGSTQWFSLPSEKVRFYYLNVFSCRRLSKNR